MGTFNNSSEGFKKKDFRYRSGTGFAKLLPFFSVFFLRIIPFLLQVCNEQECVIGSKRREVNN